MLRNSPLLLAASMGLLFAGCDSSTNPNTTQTTTYTGAKLTGNVFVLLRDQVTTAPLAQAKVTLLADSTIVKTTDSSGWLSFSGVGPGTHILRIEKTGYAGRLLEVTLNDGASDVPRLEDQSIDASLPKLGASVIGKAYYTDKVGNILPLVSDTVDLYFQTPSAGTWIGGHLTAVTDSTGSYSIANLPEDTKLNLYARSALVSKAVYTTTASQSVSILKSGETYFVPVFNLSANVETFQLLSDNLSSVALTDDLVLSFSQPVDTSALRLGDISDSAASSQVGITKAWSLGNTKLTVHPFSGKWPAGINGLTLNLKSMLGAVLSPVAYSFAAGTVNAIPGQAGAISIVANVDGRDTNVVNSNTATTTFKWGKASGADGYDLYKRDRGDNSFVKVGGTSKGTDTVIAFGTTDYFAGGDTVVFLVVAVNAKGSASLSGAPQISLTDKVRPHLVGNPGEFTLATSLADTVGTAVLDAGTVNFTFSEDVDTTVHPAFTFTNKNASKIDYTSLVLTWVWDTKSKAHVYLGVKPGKDATGIDAEITPDLGGIRDENGNTFLSPVQADWLILVAK